MTSTLELRRRLDRAQQAAADAGLCSLVVGPGADLRYLCGHDVHLTERLTALVVRAEASPLLLTPALERPSAVAAGLESLEIDIHAWDETDDPYRAIAALAGTGPCGVNDRLWAQHVLALQGAGSDVRSGSGVLAGLRQVKSPAEVDALRAAAHAIDEVHEGMGRWLRPGRTERDVAADIAAAIVAAGHARTDFVIVGSGANGASPHHEASDRRIEPGDLVVVDIGGTTADGYCSDSTRTYAVGAEPTGQMREVYDLLLTAQRAAVTSVRAGVSAHDVDAAARSIITDAGYGDAFIHRTGHGIGMETHEEPYIVTGNHTPLAEGAAFSVEPGIYLDGQFGVRIEDIVVATADGVDVLNEASRAMTVLGG